MNDLLSLVVPCYNEEQSVPMFYNRILEVLSGFPAGFEMIFINDGSSDGTLEILRGLASSDSRVRYISFSRNFGKEAGILAGLKAAAGTHIVLLDADLQHPPEYIPEMYRIIKEEGRDSVAMYRTTRKGEGKIRSFFSKRFYRVINRLSKINLVDGATDYRMMTRQMVDSVISMQEYNRFTKGIFAWVGFDTKWLAYENVERAAGETKWSFRGLIKYSLDGLIAFSTAPLAIASILGIIFCGIAFILGIIVVVKTLIWGDPVAGFPSLFCIILLIGGIQLLVLGIQGQYISRTYLETKKRPVYIIKETEAQVCNMEIKEQVCETEIKEQVCEAEIKEQICDTETKA